MQAFEIATYLIENKTFYKKPVITRLKLLSNKQYQFIREELLCFGVLQKIPEYNIQAKEENQKPHSCTNNNRNQNVLSFQACKLSTSQLIVLLKESKKINTNEIEIKSYKNP